MPEFSAVASHFDQEPVYDGYSSVSLFNAQFNTFDDASPDGNVLKRRIMSVAPLTVMPARKVILNANERWVVGDGNNEMFMGDIVRSTYWLKKATDLVTILTPAQVISGAAGTTAYAHRAYLKDTVQGVTDAEYYPMWDFFLSVTETVARGTFFKIGTTLYRARARHLELSGHILAVTDELESNNLVTVTFADAGTFDPITETYSGSSSSVSGILIDSTKLYKLVTDADPKVHSGDQTLILAANPGVGRKLTIAGVAYQVLLVTPERDAYAARLRRQG